MEPLPGRFPARHPPAHAAQGAPPPAASRHDKVLAQAPLIAHLAVLNALLCLAHNGASFFSLIPGSIIKFLRLCAQCAGSARKKRKPRGPRFHWENSHGSCRCTPTPPRKFCLTGKKKILRAPRGILCWFCLVSTLLLNAAVHNLQGDGHGDILTLGDLIRVRQVGQSGYTVHLDFHGVTRVLLGNNLPAAGMWR